MNFFRTFARTRKRVRQRATLFSLLVVILLFGLFLEAYMHNFNLVYITLFFVFASAFSAGPLGVWNIGRLEGRFEQCERLFAGREGRCFFRIDNRAASASWGIELHCGDRHAQLPRIDGYASLSASIALEPPQRGRHVFGPCALQSLFPLSTVRFVVALEQSCESLVFPDPKGEPLQTFLLRRRARFGDEQDFDGLTRYSGAESASRIHWPSVAKGETAVKTFEHEIRTDRLVFDFFQCGPNDEARLSQLCLWALECEKAGLDFTVVLPGRTLESKKAGIDAILEHLALF